MQIAPYLLIAGTAMQAVGAISQGNAQAAAAKQDAANAQANARIVTQQGTERANRVRQRARRILAEQRAAMGESGILSSSGSNLSLAADSASAAELDALTERYTASLDALGYTQRAEQARRESKTARMGGYTSAASALLGGASSYGAYAGRATAAAAGAGGRGVGYSANPTPL